MKDGSLLIDAIASNNCLCYRNVFQNDVDSFSKTVNHFLPQKFKMLNILYHTIVFKFHQHVVQYLSNDVWRDFSLPMSASVMENKTPDLKSIIVVNLPLKRFCATVANADTGILKSLRTLFDTYLIPHLNQVVWSKVYKFLSFWTKIQVF